MRGTIRRDLGGPKRAYTVGGLVIAAAIAAAITLAVGLHWLLSWLLAINAMAFAAYHWDKLCSTRGWFRVPEIALHVFSLAGGVVGAVAGHLTAHHKTRKRRFRVVYAISAVLWAGILWWVLVAR